MMLSHRIALDPTQEQEEYFLRAAGTARFVWNWALGEWNRQYALGLRPNANKLAKEFSAVKYTLFPWMKEMHRDSHSQPFRNLKAAWNKYFKDKKAGIRAYRPVFKKLRKTRPSFYGASDHFRVDGFRFKLPRLGWVKMRQPLRLAGENHVRHSYPDGGSLVHLDSSGCSGSPGVPAPNCGW